MTNVETAIMVGVFAVTTFSTRVTAFVLFPKGKKTPGFVLYLGRVLPCAITAMLIVYCLKNTAIMADPHGLPELVAVLTVVALYLCFKKSPVAIAGGTAVYMALVQVVFKIPLNH